MTHAKQETHTTRRASPLCRQAHGPKPHLRRRNRLRKRSRRNHTIEDGSKHSAVGARGISIPKHPRADDKVGDFFLRPFEEAADFVLLDVVHQQPNVAVGLVAVPHGHAQRASRPEGEQSAAVKALVRRQPELLDQFIPVVAVDLVGRLGCGPAGRGRIGRHAAVIRQERRRAVASSPEQRNTPARPSKP